MNVETEDGNVVLTARQREEAPYVVLVDALSSRGAAYNSRHKLIVEDVSPALLAFAMSRHSSRPHGATSMTTAHGSGPVGCLRVA